MIFEIKPGFAQSHFDVHEKPKSFENRANDMLFWITGINWYMSRLIIPKIPFRSLIMITWDYLSLPLIDILRHITQKAKLFHHLETVQTWLKLCPLIGTTFDPKEPYQDSSHCHNTPSWHPLTIKVPNLNKEKWKKRIMIFPSCIQDIWINPNKRNLHQRNEKPGVLKKEKSEVINQFSSRNCSLIK